uniref:Uncharacterized protein n=1 Tax=Arundo donax TaxID=35708 RepID=A0A0A9CBL6_ARUDO
MLHLGCSLLYSHKAQPENLAIYLLI